MHEKEACIERERERERRRIYIYIHIHIYIHIYIYIYIYIYIVCVCVVCVCVCECVYTSGFCLDSMTSRWFTSKAMHKYTLYCAVGATGTCH